MTLTKGVTNHISHLANEMTLTKGVTNHISHLANEMTLTKGVTNHISHLANEMHPLTCDQCLYKKHGHPTEL
jgi:hypothetical protein